MTTNHTPGPWPIGEFEENGGYDCMTCGIQVGPIKLDGADYGQELLEEPTAEQFARMYADAKLIGAAPELLEALKAVDNMLDEEFLDLALIGEIIHSAIKKATE